MRELVASAEQTTCPTPPAEDLQRLQVCFDRTVLGCCCAVLSDPGGSIVELGFVVCLMMNGHSPLTDLTISRLKAPLKTNRD